MSISTSIESHICFIGFDRADKKNAITAAMYQTMADALKAGESDPLVRVFVIHGSPVCFTAGNDLEDFMHNPPTGGNSPVFQFLHGISTATKPIIAAVAGSAIGVGTTMLMHCDMVYAADNAKFAMPFAKLGLCPEAASSFLFPAIVGYQRAAELLLTGDSFGATQAHNLGLVNRVVPADELMALVIAQAAKLVELPASSIRVTKKLLKSGQAAVVSQRMMDESVEFEAMLTSPEAREAFGAFLGKRPANFKQFA
jgi:enoyl-CoA hydratase/carnithine racemase